MASKVKVSLLYLFILNLNLQAPHHFWRPSYNITSISTSYPNSLTNINFNRTKLPSSTPKTTNNYLNNVADNLSSYCSARCSGSTLIRSSANDCQSSHCQCFQCDCTRPQCDVYGTCCPNMNHKNDSRDLHEDFLLNKNILDTKEKRLTCDDYSLKDSSFLYIRSCAVDYYVQHVIELCLEEIENSKQTPETFARAHDNRTGTVYYNQYCAHCNHISEPIMWEVAVTCENYLHVYSARNNYEFLRLSLIFGSSCSLHQEHHGKPILYPCRIGWRGEVIYSWNTSDQWSSVNENEATDCEENTSLSNPQDSIPEGHIRQPYYKNIFCAMCPSDFIPTNVYACSFVNTSKKCYYFAITIDYMPSFAIGIRHYKILPISLLLGSIGGRKTSHQPEVEFQKCQTWEWLSPDGSCLHIKCSSGKYLNGSTCKTALNSITGLGYMSRVFYLPINKLSYQFSAVNRKDRLQLLNDFMIHLQKQTLFNSDLAETQLQVTCIQDSNLFDVNVNFDGNNFSSKTLHHHMTNITEQIISQESQFFFYVSAHFVANRNISRDYFETEILTSLSFNESQVQIGTNSTIILQSMFMPDVPDFSNNTDQHSSEQSDFVDLQTKIMSNINDKESFMWTNKRDFLLLSPILTCPHVYFRKSNYSFYVNCSTFPPIWQITLNLGNIELIFSTFSELNKMAWVTDDRMTNGHLKVCLNLLEEKLHEIKDSETAFSFDNNAMYMWQYYLTHVCMSLSMVCLFMTVLAFILLTSLRNNAGINNMFLSGTLLLAQCSLLSSTHVQGPSTFCIALGISTHFLWLSVTFWSLTCCYDMFRVFNSKTGILKLKDISQRITLAKKITVNLFVPTLIIASVVLVINLISAGERIGYTDSNPCYLETRVLVLISFVAPLCFVTAINVIFFAATVYKIRNVRKLYAHTGFKRNEFETFIIYVKLSTLTGSFWVVAIISEQLDNDPLRIVAIIINSLQGVFLFVSFICNKRVMRTCFQSIPQRTSSTSTNSSVTTGGSEDSRQYERYSSF